MHFLPQSSINSGRLLLGLSLILTSHAASTPLPADEPVSIAPSITQPQLSATLPPPGFTIRVSGGTKPIQNKDVFTLSLKKFAALAITPFHSYHPAEVLPLADNDKIALAVGGPGGVYSTNYTIWGLTLATSYTVDTSFRNWIFKLYWQNRFVGQIWFVNGTRIASSTETTATSNTTDRSISQRRRADVSAQAQSQVASLGAVPAIQFLFGTGPSLRFNEVMMVIISGLSNIAPHDIHERIPGNRFSTSWGARYRGSLNIDFAWPPGLPAAWFTYNFILFLLVRLAEWALTWALTTLYPPIKIYIQEPNVGPSRGQGVLTV
ncbi:MAG: hypothetical protein Q9169_008104 [Polycauliona sp. 2 TL-2023]